MKARNLSHRLGEGAGLFTIFREHKDDADLLSDWLALDQSAPAASRFIQEICADERAAQKVALVEQILFSAFQKPLLGAGDRMAS